MRLLPAENKGYLRAKGQKLAQTALLIQATKASSDFKGEDLGCWGLLAQLAVGLTHSLPVQNA